jgi:hypothetical protein
MQDKVTKVAAKLQVLWRKKTYVANPIPVKQLCFDTPQRDVCFIWIYFSWHSMIDG